MFICTSYIGSPARKSGALARARRIENLPTMRAARRLIECASRPGARALTFRRVWGTARRPCPPAAGVFGRRANPRDVRARGARSPTIPGIYQAIKHITQRAMPNNATTEISRLERTATGSTLFRAVQYSKTKRVYASHQRETVTAAHLHSKSERNHRFALPAFWEDIAYLMEGLGHMEEEGWSKTPILTHSLSKTKNVNITTARDDSCCIRFSDQSGRRPHKDVIRHAGQGYATRAHVHLYLPQHLELLHFQERETDASLD
ncbi:hypothetical protein EVAR_9049_1 [Eumeta japonica]|uniref:Uncharacterized protein n=1 Tax=Eumeta variegata TaxID=151549 RepID=A0A4C1TW16_EUMVA|nr:hypothetical protein EVAR_9049_1 [Eumeta japonica]